MGRFFFPKFGTRKSAGYSLQKLQDLVAKPSNPAYQAWAARPGGAAAADQMIIDFYDQHHTPSHTAEGIASSLNRTLQRDNGKYAANVQKLNQFLGRASVNFYSQRLSIRGNHTKGEGYVPGRRKSEYERAADWVIKSSSTLNGQGVGGKAWKDLAHAMEAVVESATPITVDTLEFLHASAGHIAQSKRVTSDPALFYGTTALGKHLLPQVFTLARALSTQTFLNSSPKAATDLAVFLMIGAILAHPFGDGNGRSARALYACVQIKYGVRFVPAAYRWVVNQTHDVNIHDVVDPMATDFVQPANRTRPRRHEGRVRGGALETVDIAAERAAERARDEELRALYGDLLL